MKTQINSAPRMGSSEFSKKKGAEAGNLVLKVFS